MPARYVGNNDAIRNLPLMRAVRLAVADRGPDFGTGDFRTAA